MIQGRKQISRRLSWGESRTERRNIHFRDPADDSCYIIRVPSILFLPFCSHIVGMYYSCAASSLVKAGESLIF